MSNSSLGYSDIEHIAQSSRNLWWCTHSLIQYGTWKTSSREPSGTWSRGGWESQAGKFSVLFSTWNEDLIDTVYSNRECISFNVITYAKISHCLILKWGPSSEGVEHLAKLAEGLTGIMLLFWIHIYLYIHECLCKSFLGFRQQSDPSFRRNARPLGVRLYSATPTPFLFSHVLDGTPREGKGGRRTNGRPVASWLVYLSQR